MQLFQVFLVLLLTVQSDLFTEWQRSS